MKRSSLYGSGLALLLLIPLGAQALYFDGGAISWRGSCLDCNEAPSAARAVLSVLSLNDVAGGTDIGGGNLDAFAYYSDLYPYGVFAGFADIVSAVGVIPPAPNAFAAVVIDFFPSFGYAGGGAGTIGGSSAWQFETTAAGEWCLGAGDCDPYQAATTLDFGTAGRFNVPEPATLALCAIAIAAAGRHRRRRARA